MGFFSDIFDPGKKNREAAAGFAQDAQVTGGQSSGPGGVSAGFNFGADGRGTISQSLGSFDPFLSLLQDQAAEHFASANRGISPQLRALGGGAIADMGTPDINRFGNFGGAGALAGILQQSAGIAGADPFALGAQTADRLRQRSTRSNENLVNKSFDRLFSSGGLSNSVTREEVTGDISRQLDEQDLGFELAGLQQGQQLQNQAFGRTMGAFGGLESFGQRQFSEQVGEAGLRAQLAQQRFGIGAHMQGLDLQSMLSGQQLGLNALQGAQGLQQMPLQQLSAILQAQGQRSDAALGGASAHTNLAQIATSPLLGALEAGGSFASAIGGFGGIADLMKQFGVGQA